MSSIGRAPGRVNIQNVQPTNRGETSRTTGRFPGVNNTRNVMSMPESNSPPSSSYSASQQRLSASTHSLVSYLSNNPPQRPIGSSPPMPSTLPASSHYSNQGASGYGHVGQSHRSDGASPKRPLSKAERTSRNILSQVKDHESGGKELNLFGLLKKSGGMNEVEALLIKDSATLATKLEAKASKLQSELNGSRQSMNPGEAKALSSEIRRLTDRARALRDFGEALR